MCNFFSRAFYTFVILAMFFADSGASQNSVAQNVAEPLEVPKRPQITIPSRGAPNPVALRTTYSDIIKELAKIDAMLPQLGEDDKTLIETLHSQRRTLLSQQNQIAAQLQQLGLPFDEAVTQANGGENSVPEKIALRDEIIALRTQISSLQNEVSTLRGEMQKLTSLIQSLMQQLSPQNAPR